MKKFALAALAAIAVFGASSVQAASDTQTFTVTVAPTLTITAPANASMAHNTTNANQVFPNQDWAVTCNNAAGADVSFQITTFANGAVERDASLAVSVTSANQLSAGWVVSNSPQTTAGTGTTATVLADSVGPGNATFTLGVSFLDTDYAVLPAGDYIATVTGTITAK
ncbi:MAG: hypothetical protein R3C01_01765 [Planctomycetaceae bacterium]